MQICTVWEEEEAEDLIGGVPFSGLADPGGRGEVARLCRRIA